MTTRNNTAVKRILKQVNVMILGSGWPRSELKKRREIKSKLGRRGINAFIMEDQKQPKYQSTHVDKFVELLGKKNLLCIAIITKNGDTRGLTFEIGYICGHHGRSKKGKKKLENELGFLIQKGVDRKCTLTSYINTGLFSDGIKMQQEYSTIDDIVAYTEVWTKNRAKELGLL